VSLIRFEQLAWTEDLPEALLPLLRNHYTEIARYHDIPLNPDFDMYRGAALIGALRIFVVFCDYEIAGYNIFFVKHNPHYKDSLQAVQDILYMKPATRTFTAFRFIKWCDEQLCAEGVQVVMHHVKVYKDFGRLLELIGYEPVDTIYARRLDGHRSSDSGSGDIRRSRSSGSKETGSESPEPSSSPRASPVEAC
jgi:hypothetical protein